MSRKDLAALMVATAVLLAALAAGAWADGLGRSNLDVDPLPFEEPASQGDTPVQESLQGSAQGPNETKDEMEGAGGNGQGSAVDAGNETTPLATPPQISTPELGSQPSREALELPLDAQSVERPGDKKEKPGFWATAKGMAKTALNYIGPVGALAGLGYFLLFGVAALNPAAMVGGLLAAMVAVLIGAAAQSLFSD